MNPYQILAFIEFVILIFILIYNWKNILSMIWKDKFLEIEIVNPSGIVKTHLHYVKERGIFKNDNNEYYTLKTSYMKNGHKYYMFKKDDPNHLDLLKDETTKNKLFEMKRAEINYAELFKEKIPILDRLLQLALPFLVGVILGVLVATLQAQGT